MKSVSNYVLSALLIMCSAFATAEVRVAKLPLYFFIFVHDDISAEDRVALRGNYISWATKEIEGITGRKVYVEYIEHDPSMTRFAYPNENKEVALQEWTSRVDAYRLSHPQPLNKRYKYLLLTKHRLNASTLGVAAQSNYSGIASIQTFQAAAHEFGHMLGATHEAAQTSYIGGWWCSTIMGGYSPLTSNCYIYSDGNRKAIADYLKNTK